MYLATEYVATVLTVYGIETVSNVEVALICFFRVATVLTVYGIETKPLTFLLADFFSSCNSTYRLRY